MAMAIVSDQVLCLTGFAEFAAARDPSGGATIFPDLSALRRALKDHRFSLIVIDLSLESVHAPAQLTSLVESAAPARLVGLDIRLNRRQRSEVMAAGFDGYLLKTMSGEMVAAALDLVRAGAQYFVDEDDVGGSTKDVSPLTERQTEVLRLVVAGKSNKEIGKLLDISTPTVKLHLNRILKRLVARNRTEAAMIGLELLR